MPAMQLQTSRVEYEIRFPGDLRPLTGIGAARFYHLQPSLDGVSFAASGAWQYTAFDYRTQVQSMTPESADRSRRATVSIFGASLGVGEPRDAALFTSRFVASVAGDRFFIDSGAALHFRNVTRADGS